MYREFLPGALCVTAALALPAFGTALDVKASGTKTFYLNSHAGYNQITVMSESMLEDFTILVNKVSGECTLDPTNLETFKGRFSFKLKDVKTGIDLRDEHMLTGWLDAARFPDIVVTVKSVDTVEKTGRNSAKMILLGTLSLHGVTRDVRIPVTLTYLNESPETMLKAKGDVIRARGAFEIKLSDFKVTGPLGTNLVDERGDSSRRGIAVANVLHIRVSVFGASEPPPTEPADEEASSQPAGAASQPAMGAGAGPRQTPPKRAAK